MKFLFGLLSIMLLVNSAHAYYFDIEDTQELRALTRKFANCRKAEQVEQLTTAKFNALERRAVSRSNINQMKKIAARQTEAVDYILACACAHDWNEIRPDMVQVRIEAGCRR